MTYYIPDAFRKVSKNVTQPIYFKPEKKQYIPQHRLMPEKSILENIMRLELICSKFSIDMPKRNDFNNLIEYKDNLELLIIKCENSEIRKYNNANSNKICKT